jgi:UDP-3-O-[3-hydroxymyristoyl] glucosamine N-acyltransferase
MTSNLAPADMGIARRLLATAVGTARRWEARYVLRRCSVVGKEVRVKGRVWIHGGGRIVLGDRVVLDASCAPIELHALAGGEILIGNDAFIEGGTSIESVQCVSIGDRAHLGMFCKVMDTHFHSLTRDRAMPASHAVVIEPDVTLGVYTIVVAAGIERGAFVPPRSIVRRRVQAPATRRVVPALSAPAALRSTLAPAPTVTAIGAPVAADVTTAKEI